MAEKYIEINTYIDNLATYLNQEYPNILSDEQISRAKTMFNGSSENIDSIKSQIDDLTRQTIEEYVKRKEKQQKFRDVTKKRVEHIKCDYGIEFDDDKIEQFTPKMLEQNLSREQIDRRFEAIDESIKSETRKKVLEEQVKSGMVDSNFSDIRETVGILFDDSMLSSTLSIYGGTIPYIMTGEEPKRIIGDVDTHAKLEDMSKIRKYILEHQDKYHIISDSLQLCGEDYGMELSVNGVDVSIFPTIASNDGMVVRNFSIQESLEQITTKATLFGGINEESQIINYNSNGRNIRLMSPEFTYITKAAAKREKDVIDNQVLAKVVDSEKLRQMQSTMKKPEVIETQTKRIDIKKKQDDFHTQTGQTLEQESFAKRSQSEVKIANQIKNKNKIIKYQKEQQKQKNKPKVKTLTQSSSNSSSTGSKGFANVITLSLIVSFVCGTLFMIVYMAIKG
jgi:hypothetical protein